MRLFSRGRGEPFLILDVLPDRIQGALLNVDEERHIAPITIWDHIPVHKLARILPPRVALAFHHSLLFTKEISLELNRDHDFQKTPLDSLELENAAAQAIGKSFQEYRREAAKFLGVSEFDTALVNNVMNNFVVDGKSVEHLGEPIAKRITAKLHLQFTRRDLFDVLKDAWNVPAGFSLFSREEGKLSALRKRDKRADMFLALESDAQGGSSATLLWIVPKTDKVNRTPLKWSREEIAKKIMSHTGVDMPVAEAMYHMYLRKEMSPRVLKSFSTAIAPTVASLQKEISSVYRGRALTVEPAHELPGNIRVHLADYEAAGRELAEHFGFRVNPSEWRLPPHEFFGYIASFIGHYYDKNDHALNQSLQRRVHWLAPTPNE